MLVREHAYYNKDKGKKAVRSDVWLMKSRLQ